MINLERLFYTFLCFTLLQSSTSFEVYWNVPTQQCLRKYHQDFTKLLKTFEISVNSGDKFQGDSITIFYESKLGYYPTILKNGTWENGGLPQAADISKHLEKVIEDIENTIPKKSFNGIGVIDWESWRPSWHFNWTPLDIYREKSKEFARKNNPTLSDKEINELAKHQWEEAARSYMLKTLELSKKLRPLAHWGYYLFPDCYNYIGKKPIDFECSKKVKLENDKFYVFKTLEFSERLKLLSNWGYYAHTDCLKYVEKKPADFECSKDVKLENNKLSWLWNSSTGIFPSIYLNENHLNDYTYEQRSYKDHGKLKEAMRVAPADAKVLPYINFHLKSKFVPQADFQRMAAQAASVGANGFIIWGSSSDVSSADHCNKLNNYIVKILGPTVKKVSQNADKCSHTVCHGNGQCTWPNDANVTAWKLFLNDDPSFDKNDIMCRCKSSYTGKFCERE